jgi:hypothetical protein
VRVVTPQKCKGLWCRSIVHGEYELVKSLRVPEEMLEPCWMGETLEGREKISKGKLLG